LSKDQVKLVSPSLSCADNVPVKAAFSLIETCVPPFNLSWYGTWLPFVTGLLVMVKSFTRAPPLPSDTRTFTV
jgi:hypothetical protein